jgi:hypothetical protein
VTETKSGEFTCTAAYRKDDHPSLSITVQDDAGGGLLWIDRATGEKGNGFTLAKRLDVDIDEVRRRNAPVPTAPPRQPPRPPAATPDPAPGPDPETFADARAWCEARGLSWGALCETWDAHSTGRHPHTLQIRFPVPGGLPLRVRGINPHLPGAPPKARWAEKGGKPCLYGLQQSRALLTGGPLYIVNGEPSVWAAVQSGVPALCFCAGEGTLPPVELLKELVDLGVPLRVAYDADDQGQKGAAKLVQALQDAGAADVAALDLGAWGGWGGPHPKGADVDDLHRRTGDSDLEAALRSLPVLSPPPALQPAPDAWSLERSPGCRRMDVNAPLHERTLEALDVLSAADVPVYLFRGSLAFIRNGHEPPAPWERSEDAKSGVRVSLVAEDAVRNLLSERMEWYAVRAGGPGLPPVEKPAQPPRDVARSIATLSSDVLTDAPGRLKPCTGIVRHPVMRRTRADVPELWAGPAGWCPVSGLWMADHGMTLTVPPKPSQDDARAALDVLRGLVDEVPFACEGSRAAFLAALLTPGATMLIGEGQSLPFFLVEADSPGAGKTRLATIIGQLWTGTAPALSPYSSDDAEMEKRIGAWMSEGSELVCLDNIRDRFGGASVESLITSSGVWSTRRLGTNATISGKWRPVILGTGNDATMTPDMMQRTILCELSHDGTMQDRTEFRIPDVVRYIREHRARLLSAVFTILQGYQVKGAPKVTAAPMGRFPEWARTVRDALVWAGAADAAGPIRARYADPEDAPGFNLQAFADAARALHTRGAWEFTAAGLVTQTSEGGPEGAPGHARDALQACIRAAGKGAPGRALARALRELVGDGWRRVPDTHGATWTMTSRQLPNRGIVFRLQVEGGASALGPDRRLPVEDDDCPI